MSYPSLGEPDWRVSIDRLTPAQLTGVYLAFGAVLLVLTDLFLPMLVPDLALLAWLQAVEGGVEVVLTAGLIYVLSRRTNARLRRSESRYRNLLETSPAPINLFDEEGRTVWGNDAVLDLLGLERRSDLVGRSIFEFIHPDDRDVARGELRDVIERGESMGPTSMRLVREDGESRHVRVSTTVGWENESVVGQAIVVDVTESRELQAELRAERDFLEGALDALRDAFFVLDDEGRFVDWNGRVPELLGLDASTLGGRRATELVPEGEAARVEAAVETALEAGEVFELVAAETADGERRRFEVAMARMRPGDGRGTQLVGTARDVTDRVHRDRELRRLSEEYEAVFEHAQDSLFLVDVDDADGDYEFVFSRLNPSHEEISGLATESVRGKTPREVLGEELGAEVAANYRRCVERRESVVYEEVLPPLGEETVWRTKLTPVIVDGEVTQIVGIARDVTERKRMERRLRENERRYRTLVETSPNPVVVHVEGELIYANGTTRELLGLEADSDLAGSDLTRFLDPVVEGGDTEAGFEPGDDAPTRTRRTIRTAGGEERSVVVASRPITYEGERAVLSVFQDVTERHRYEERLRTLLERTREMARAERAADIVSIAVEAAAELLDAPRVVFYGFDGRGGLVPGGPPGEAGEADSTITEGPIWDAFSSGDPGHASDVGDHRLAADLEGATLLPVGNHGVVAVGDEGDGPLEGAEDDLASLVVAHLEAALDRAGRDRDLGERDHRLERQNEALEQLDRLNGIIRRVVRTVVRADTRAEILAGVCDEFAAEDAYAIAWIGTRDPVDAAVSPEQWAGVDSEYLDHLDAMGTSSALLDLVLAAFESGDVQAANDILDAQGWAAHRADALDEGFQSLAAVPIGRRNAIDCVLVVHAAGPRGFDDRERAVLAELGETVAYALENVGPVEAVGASPGVEVELEIDDDRLVTNRIAAGTGGVVELVGLVSDSDETVRAFVRVKTTGSTEDLVDTLEGFPSIESARLLARDEDGALVQLTMSVPALVRVITAHGIQLVSLVAEAGTSELRLVVPGDGEVRTVVEAVAEAYPETELVARRERSTPVDTHEGFREQVLDDLTEKQREALRTAYYGGFYEWPRTATSEELAATMEIASSTFQYHLRAAERKTVGALLEPREGPSPLAG